MQRTSRKSIQGIVVMLVLAAFVSCALAKEQKSEDIKKSAEAMYLLMYMAEYLSGAGQLQVRITSEYDVVQSSGRKIEFNESRQLALIRPAKMRVDVERDDGNTGVVLFDGNNISAYDRDRKVVATASRPGDIDGALKYFVKDLKMRIPLAILFTANLPSELEKRLVSAEVIQRVVLFDVPCLQIAAVADTVDFQIWIPEKGEPLPRRIVITYKNDKGQPQFRADLSHWSTSQNIQESNFNFIPPEGTQRVPFLAEISNLSGVPTKKRGQR